MYVIGLCQEYYRQWTFTTLCVFRLDFAGRDKARAV
jgi:hypothetical protein